ncbi:MAG: hypothetical protein O2890_02480, partial [Cyanobacteria bacterium]|nr:hypothetical protein [Cyanobacteriota bacterium]
KACDRFFPCLCSPTLSSALHFMADIAAIKGGEFVEACLESSNLEEPVCQCLSAKANEMLTPDALKFLVATLKQDVGTANTLREMVPPADLAEAGMFMVQETAGCAAPQ